MYVIRFFYNTAQASFTLRWTGVTGVRVILVHPSEAVSVLRRVRRGVPSRWGYGGRFEKKSGNKTVREDTKCNIHPPEPEVSCLI